MASLNGDEGEHRCLACGGEMAPVLWRLGSILCHDCRSAQRTANRALLERWAEAQRVAALQAARQRGR